MNRKPKSIYYFLIILMVGFIFLRSGVEKVAGGTFVINLPKTLSQFAGGNPYPSVQTFLLKSAIPNAAVFGYLTMYGELICGALLMISAIYYILNGSLSRITSIMFVIGLTGASLLNDVYWLSSGWMSPSSFNLNLLMLFISLIGFVYVIREILPFLTPRVK